jgi:general secretion pathway protein E
MSASLNQETLQQARQDALKSARPLMAVLQERLGLDNENFLRHLGEGLKFPLATMVTLASFTPAFEVVGFAEAGRRLALAMQDKENRWYAVLSNPFDRSLQLWLEDRMPADYTLLLAHPADISALLVRHESGQRALDSVNTGTDAHGAGDERGDELSLSRIAESTSPVVKLVHSTLFDALKLGASDIHLETGSDGMEVKYRIDGVLNRAAQVSGLDTAQQAISRIKVMAELDISERRIPQDGRFRVRIEGREVDFRVSIMPSVHGEDAVLRVLDRQALTEQMQGLNLERLGLDGVTLARFRKLCQEPYGMALVTGPTGSGKTTTLYAALTEINHGRDKIITIEDPVEYQLPGVLQIPVNEKKGLTFARGLRSILRHDPDKIMVGEIRDAETAQIAVQSALTGHLVLSTVHANNVYDVIGRFLQLGVDGYSLVSALNGVLAQRLVRVNCPHCTRPAPPSAQLLEDSGLAPEQAANYQFAAGAGCGHCRGSGYKGRKAIAELLVLNDELRELIINRAPLRQIKQAARAAGARNLRESALEWVARGETTLEEINRVTFVD